MAGDPACFAMTYSECVRILSTVCTDRSEAEAEARVLLCRLFCLSGAQLAACSRERDFCSPALDEALAGRLDRVPLAYILGEQPFWKFVFSVSENCLIPRQETEILVEEAVRVLPAGRFLDLCTGSGCIAISILRERADLTGAAVDLSDKALELCRLNAERLNVADRLDIRQGNALTAEGIRESDPFDGLVCNPPYIETDTIPTLSAEVLREPRAALDGGPDGLAFYRAILETTPAYIKDSAPLLFEIGWNQGDAIAALATGHGYACRIIRDLEGHDRVAHLSRNI